MPMAVLSPRTVILDSSRLAPFEIGALLLSVLAFPGPTEEDECNRAAEALCADLLRETIRAYPDQAAKWQDAYPDYFAIGRVECRRCLRTYKRRLRDRMVAARMSLGYFQEGIAQQPATLPPSINSLSLNELSKLVLSQSGESNSENVEHRAWRGSRPVIHLAAAIQIEARALAPDEKAFGYPLDNGPLHEAVIRLARIHE